MDFGVTKISFFGRESRLHSSSTLFIEKTQEESSKGWKSFLIAQSHAMLVCAKDHLGADLLDEAAPVLLGDLRQYILS